MIKTHQNKTIKVAPVVRAIDLGSGYTKYSVATPEGIAYKSFASVAIRSEANSRLRGAETMTAQRNTRFIPVDGAYWEVGPDAASALTGQTGGSSTSDQYSHTAEYDALMRGALSYIGESVIDQIVLGLPVNTWRIGEAAKALEKKYTGEIELEDGQFVTIKNVSVQPQPLGGLLELQDYEEQINAEFAAKYGQGGGVFNFTAEEINETMDVLVVDPGSFTCDHLYVVAGGKINERASGASSGTGRMAILEAVREWITQKLGMAIGMGNLQRIDAALRTERKIYTHQGRPVALDNPEVADRIRSVVLNPINQIQQQLKGAEDALALIVVIGGHPTYYADELRRRFPNIPLVVPNESVFANVRGFQALGQAMVEAQAAEVA